MHSIAQVLNPEFPRSWHEAVAIVQEVASQLQPGLAVPGPQDLLLEESGVLSFGFASESNESPVTGLATLLEALLDGADAPTALRDLATENARPSPAHATVAGFSRALAFYERPNRPNDLAAVAGRLRASQKGNSVVDSEFERLREKVASKAESEETPPPVSKRPRITRRQQFAIATVIVLAAGVTSFVWSGASATSPGRLMKSAEHKVARAVTAGLDRLGVRSAAAADTPAVPTPSATQAPEETKPQTTTPRPRRAQASSAPSLTSRSTSRSMSPSAPPRTLGIRQVRPLPPNPRETSTTTAPKEKTAAPPTVAAPTASVYSSKNSEVQPPVFVRPQLPREPAPGADTGYFEVVVDEAGHVEQVKLISPMRRYHERMLMAAAKAWKFKPATMNGVPVKYRMQVPITLQGMPWP